MSEASVKDDFLLAADAWLCDNYALDIRYIARPSTESAQIICASIAMHPLEATIDNSFNLAMENLIAGQMQKYPVSKSELSSILNQAINGKIFIESSVLTSPGSSNLQYYTETTNQNSWTSDLHLQIISEFNVALPFNLSEKIDNDLRVSTIPFDGISDLANWLGFQPNILSGQTSKIIIRINPPVALLFDECKLQDDCLKLILHAHSNFDLKQLGLAVRGVPADGIAGRVQAAQLINWGSVLENKREGAAFINIKNCDSALVMLMVGSAKVRRQWFLDSTKARNNRYIAVQNFDAELQQVNRSLFNTHDADKFEKAVAALFFMLGFSPMIQLETNAPDLVITTPGGQLVIVECTLKVSNFSEKLGKLVDRRVALSNALKEAGHPSDITALLICSSSEDQIAKREDELKSYKVLLWTRAEIEELFNSIRTPNDPDKIIDAIKERLNNQENIPI